MNKNKGVLSLLKNNNGNVNVDNKYDDNKYDDINVNVYIVVSRFNEKLEWMLEYPFSNFEYIVYNKGENDNFEKKYVKKIINIPNVGREGHTYLYHIINHYNNLPNILIFLPGSVDSLNKIDKAKNILLNIINSNYLNAYFIGSNVNNIYKHFKGFKIDNYCSSSIDNKTLNNEFKLQKAKIRPFGKWYLYFFGNQLSHWWTTCGIFSIDKRDVIQHPINRYETLIKTLECSSNPETGHYIERTWGTIFYPLIYTKKMN
jgi:hypothetical protein